MSVWKRISDALLALRAGEGLSRVFEYLRSPPERSVAFTIAVVALSAKMAKADGLVTRDEVTAFREVFYIARKDEDGAARVFNLAREDAAGYEHYARTIRGMFESQTHVLDDLLEGLFYIAMADGVYHPNENTFLENVAQIFEIPQTRFECLRSLHVPGAEPSPYQVLGVQPSDSIEDIRMAWRALVRDNHPDRVIARGLPEEAIKLAEKRLIGINRAWENIQEAHA